MPKRTTFQGKRRQVRRALNSTEEIPSKMGLSRTRHIGYGTALSAYDLKTHKERDEDDRD